MLLEAKGITFGYRRGINIIEDFSLSVESGERVGIIAPSGRGKTTLCSILSGYLKPDEGRVLLDGVDVYGDRPKGANPIQMIWQHPEKSVDPSLRLRETMREAVDLEDRVVKGLGIAEDWFNRYPTELSGGEIQRFCIARALGRGTRFVIADEISTMLDLITQAQVWDFLLKEVAERNIGLIAVTHSDMLMDHVATRVVELGAHAR